MGRSPHASWELSNEQRRRNGVWLSSLVTHCCGFATFIQLQLPILPAYFYVPAA